MSKRERRTARRHRERQRTQQLEHVPVVVDDDVADDEHERAVQRAGETA